MLSELQKTILKKSVQIRLKNEEDVTEVFKSYKNITEDEKKSILSECSISYDLTLDEVKNKKIKDFSSTCKQNIENGVTISIDGQDEHFSYSIENGDQGNIDDIFSLAVSTGLSQPYHCDGGNCKLYTVQQISELYVACKILKAKETTYFNQIKQYIIDLEDKETIESITYGQELTGTYLSNYNAMMEQSQAIIQALSASGLNLTEGTETENE